MQELDETIVKYGSSQKSQIKQIQSQPILQMNEICQNFSQKIDHQYQKDQENNKIDSIFPFQPDFEIYQSEALFGETKDVQYPKVLLEELQTIKGYLVKDFPLIKGIFLQQKLCYLTANSTLFLWNMDAGQKYKKVQFEDQIQGISVGQANNQIFEGVQYIMLISFQKYIKFFKIDIIGSEIQFEDLNEFIKVDRIYHQIHIHNGRMFIGSMSGDIKEICYSTKSFLFYTSQLNLKSTSFFNFSFNKEPVHQLGANENYLFALRNVVRVYDIQEQGLTHLYDLDDLIGKLNDQKLYLPNKQDWTDSDLEVQKFEPLEQEINLLLITFTGIRIYLRIEQDDYEIAFIKFQGSQYKQDIVKSNYDEELNVLDSAGDGLSSVFINQNRINGQLFLVCYQQNANQEEQFEFQPKKNEQICSKELYEFEEYQIYLSRNDQPVTSESVRQIFSGQKQIIIMHQKGIQIIPIKRPIDILYDIISDDKEQLKQRLQSFTNIYSKYETQAMLIQLMNMKQNKDQLKSLISKLGHEQGLIIYLARILQPIWDQLIVNNLIEIEIIQKKIKELLEFVQAYDKDLNLELYLKFIKECLSLIVYLGEARGIRKLIQTEITFRDIINGSVNFQIKEILKKFLKHYPNRSQNIKHNFPSFFTSEDQQLFISEDLMEHQNFYQSQQILIKYLQNLSENQILQYLHQYFIPQKQMFYFIDLIFKKYQLDQINDKTKNQKNNNQQFCQAVIFDLIAELIYPEEIEQLLQTNDQIKNDNLIEQYGMFKGYQHKQKYEIILYTLKKMDEIDKLEFHEMILQLLVKEGMFDLICEIESQYFKECILKLKNQENQKQLLQCGYKHYAGKESKYYECFKFSQELYQIQNDISLQDRKIYVFIAIQNLEKLISKETDLLLRKKYQEALAETREDEKNIEIQEFVMTSLKQKQDHDQEIIQQIEELDKKLFQLQELYDKIIVKFRLYDCFIYFALYQTVDQNYIISTYKNLFYQIYLQPRFFRDRVQKQLSQIYQNIGQSPKLELLFPLTEIVDLIESINIKDPQYQDYFDYLDPDQFEEHSPFWLPVFLLNDLKIEPAQILSFYQSNLKIQRQIYQTQQSNFDKYLYFVSSLIIVPYSLLVIKNPPYEKLIQSTKIAEEYLCELQDQLQDLNLVSQLLDLLQTHVLPQIILHQNS